MQNYAVELRGKAALCNRFDRFCKSRISTWGKYGVDLNTEVDKIFD